MRLTYLILPAALGLAAGGGRAVEAPTSQVASVEDLASLFEGEFTTAPAAAAGTPAPSAGDRVLYDLSKRVDVPALGRDVVYSEMREGAPDGKLVWQRLYALKLDSDTGRIVMTPYSFANPQDLAGASKDTKPLAKLQPADLKPQQGGCVLTWHRIENGFAGTVKPGSCKNAPPEGNTSLQPVITVTKTELTEQLDNPQSPNPLVFRRLH